MSIIWAADYLCGMVWLLANLSLELFEGCLVIRCGLNDKSFAALVLEPLRNLKVLVRLRIGRDVLKHIGTKTRKNFVWGQVNLL